MVGSQFCSRWGFWPEKIRSHRKKNEGNEWSATFNFTSDFYSSIFHMVVGKKTKQSGGSGFELYSDSNGSVKPTSEMADKLYINSIFITLFVNKA
jgi:hypothetical protein